MAYLLQTLTVCDRIIMEQACMSSAAALRKRGRSPSFIFDTRALRKKQKEVEFSHLASENTEVLQCLYL